MEIEDLSCEDRRKVDFSTVEGQFPECANVRDSNRSMEHP